MANPGDGFTLPMQVSASWPWPPQTFAQQGWQCPVCERVYSPSMVMCSHCPPRIESTTTTDTAPKVESYLECSVCHHQSHHLDHAGERCTQRYSVGPRAEREQLRCSGIMVERPVDPIYGKGWPQ